MTFNFSFGQKQTEPEKPQFQLTEQMVIEKGPIPNDILKQFVDIYNSIHSNDNISTLPPKNDTLEFDIESLEQATNEALNGPLISLTNQIDYGTQTINEYATELATSQSDLRNSKTSRSLPTPFISRSVARIEQQAKDISDSLASYESRLLPSMTDDMTSTMYDLLQNQHNAILRCASKVSKLRDELDSTRTLLAAKLGVSTLHIVQSEERDNLSGQQSLTKQIKSKNDQFKADREKDLEKRQSEADLFGGSKNVAKPATNSWGGGAFGFNKNTGFGKTTTDKK